MTLPFARTSFPEMYEEGLVEPLFRPWVDMLLDNVAFRPEDRVLDVACGTGIVARIAKQRGGPTGRIVGIDVNAGMLGVARSKDESIDWREGDATALPLRDGEQFDVVVCQQGLQFFPDRPAAAREFRRALAPRGRLGVSVWRSDDEIPFGRELRHVAERHLGPIVDRRHHFGDPAALEAVLRDAGFREIRTRPVSRTIRFADGATFVRLNTMALVGMSSGAKALSEDERARLTAAIIGDSAGVLDRYTASNELLFDISTNIAIATA